MFRSDRRARGAATVLPAILCVVAASSFVVRATSDRPDSEEIVRRWRDGPARYLLTTEEDAVVRELTTIPDLARFITQFWKKRDPSPRTLANEYRKEFWERVRYANARFRDSAEPGWKSDRGKVFILLGEPSQIESDDVRIDLPDLHAGTTTTGGGQRTGEPATAPGSGGHEVLRWHYLRKRSKSAAPEFIVAFERSGSGEWRLSTDPKLIAPNYSSVSTDPSQDTSFGHPELRASNDRQRMFETMRAARAAVVDTADPPGGSGGRPDAGILQKAHALNDLKMMGQVADAALQGQRAEMAAASAGLAGDSALFANYDLGLETGLPSESEMAVAVVTAQDFLSSFTPEPRFEFFRARDGSTFVNIGARVRESDVFPPGASGARVAQLALYVRVTSPADPKLTRYTTNASVSPVGAAPTDAPGGGAVDVWAGLALPPGHYDMTLALEDAGTGRLGRGSASFDVPDLGKPGLGLSTLILASELSTSEGQLQVGTRSTGVFRRSEAFGIYYEVYGLSEPARFTATYRFERATAQGWIALGKPIAQPDRTEAAQGWSFPLAKWPAGRYRLIVQVDAAGRGGAGVSQSAEFQIIE